MSVKSTQTNLQASEIQHPCIRLNGDSISKTLAYLNAYFSLPVTLATSSHEPAPEQGYGEWIPAKPLVVQRSTHDPVFLRRRLHEKRPSIASSGYQPSIVGGVFCRGDDDDGGC
jgi:hypothetical protein